MADPAGHADAGLYLHLLAFGIVGKCKLAFISMLVCVYARSPVKKFASCRLREKNFASLRLRQNLVELRARLSLLVDKTTFQYSVLTIYYTTIGGHAPFLPVPSASTPQRKGTPWTCRITTPQRRQPWRKGRHGRAGSPPPAPAAVAEGTPWTRWITLPQEPPAMAEGDALDASDHPSASTARGRHRVPFFRPC